MTQSVVIQIFVIFTRHNEKYFDFKKEKKIVTYYITF